MVSLCRARGIPTIVTSGFLLFAHLGAGATPPGDSLGLWFDPAYTRNETHCIDFPHFSEAYLVLHAPSAGAVGGWECRAVTDGPVTPLGWDLEGQAVNFVQPPQFVVGLGSPLPTGDAVLLATLQFMITAGDPVVFGLTPVERASIPGAMAYIPFDDPDDLRPLSTVTGVSEVAWCNREASAIVAFPQRLDFGGEFTGSIGKVVISNTGDEPSGISVWIPTPRSRFSIIAGGGQYLLAPGARHVVWLQLQPEPCGTDSLLISPAAPAVELGCRDAPGRYPLDFDIVPTGGRRSFQLPIQNPDYENSHVVRPISSDPDFYGEPEVVLLPPRGSVQMTLTFAPTTPGVHVGSVHFADSIDPLPVRGEGGRQGEDLVGLWWDADLGRDITESVTAGLPFHAWLAMVNPSEPVGTSGWELALELDTQTLLTNVELRGQAFNFLEQPEFLVGLGTPLPWAPEVVLAELDLLVMDQVWHDIRLVPVESASIPNSMCWSYGEGNSLKPLYATTGGAIVAWFRASTSVALAAPTPTATLSGGRVELRWPIPTDGADGCHVFRAIDGSEAQLTASLLRPTAGGYIFDDDVTALSPGTTVRYSYAIVRGGVEIARSPESAIELPGPESLNTRLLPNRPNPFNPQTTIPFVLARAGHVRLEVYDLAGRRVAVPLDGLQPAGLRQVIWRGVDDAGRPLPSGAFYVRLVTDTVRSTRKIMLIK